MPQRSPVPSSHSHGNCDLHVMAMQITESSKEPIEPFIEPSFVNLNISVSSTFLSENPWNDMMFTAPSTVGRVGLTSAAIESPAECRERIRNFLADTGVPHEFSDCAWRHKFLNAEEFDEMCRAEDLDTLVENVCWFLYKVKSQQHNHGFTFLPVNFVIEKLIVVRDDEFEEGISWYEEMVRNPDSGTQKEELLKELGSKFTAASKRRL